MQLLVVLHKPASLKKLWPLQNDFSFFSKFVDPHAPTISRAWFKTDVYFEISAIFTIDSLKYTCAWVFKCFTHVVCSSRSPHLCDIFKMIVLKILEIVPIGKKHSLIGKKFIEGYFFSPSCKYMLQLNIKILD